MPERPDQQACDQQPGQECGDKPHQEGKKQQQAVTGRDLRNLGSDDHLQASSGHRPAAGGKLLTAEPERFGRQDRQFIGAVANDQRLDVRCGIGRGTAKLGLGERACRHSAGHADAKGQRFLVGKDAERDIARRDQAQ